MKKNNFASHHSVPSVPWRIALGLLSLFLILGLWACKSKETSPDGSTPAASQALSGPLLDIYYFDIGQGDSALLRAPGGEDILIDSGDRGSHIVDKLQGLGVQRLALVIATHPHSDHIGEIRSVLETFPVTELWDSGYKHGTKTYERMLTAVKERHVRYTQPKAGTTKSFGPVHLEVLHPEPGDPIDSNPNDASIVVRVRYGEKRFLFTGDAELPSWEQMFEKHREQLRADGLKAAHHGSSNGTTSGVLVNVRPEIVIVSCALGNSYHHPHPTVVRLLKERSDKIRFLRTDLHGTIHLATDGKTLSVKTEKHPTPEQVYMTGDETAESAGVEVKRSRGRR